MKVLPVATVLGIFGAGGMALADAPPEPPVANPIFCSASGEACAATEPGRGTILVTPPAASSLRPWRIDKVMRAVTVSNDGASLVEIGPGADMLARDAKNPVLLTFWRPGQPPFEIRLQMLVAKPDSLPRSVSSRVWASSYGYEEADRFVINTAEGNLFEIDPHTGQSMNRPYLQGR